MIERPLTMCSFIQMQLPIGICRPEQKDLADGDFGRPLGMEGLLERHGRRTTLRSVRSSLAKWFEKSPRSCSSLTECKIPAILDSAWTRVTSPVAWKRSCQNHMYLFYWGLVWWTWSGSNRRPLPCHGSALPTAPQVQPVVIFLIYTTPRSFREPTSPIRPHLQ